MTCSTHFTHHAFVCSPLPCLPGLADSITITTTIRKLPITALSFIHSFIRLEQTHNSSVFHPIVVPTMKYSLIILATVLASATAFAPSSVIPVPQLAVVPQPQSILRMAPQDDSSTSVVDQKTESTQTDSTSLEASTPEEEKSETAKLLEKIKASGKAGVISYALWELAFWFISIPIAVLGYVKVAGHWPDFSNKDDAAGVGAEAFAFVNFARFAVPLRIGLALSSVGFVQEKIVDKFFPEEEAKDE